MTEASGIDEDETRLPFSGEADAILAVENQPFIVSSLVADGETVLMVIRPSLWMSASGRLAPSASLRE